ncbi:MAG TPA: FHA domain-containing serine/threonine-protein kinase [Planctomycetaceae bacterium]|jgi:pSer/pThr/pTyr-binding forkhead associated (FHA) protein|nr:FHA domain-containing serine/threonine-protein kinase [Planctomycetaceae bacterium]
MNYFANIISGPNVGQRRELTDHAILVVGRGDDCDLRLSDPSVSRIHARITLVDGHVYLEDAGSRWGTLVNNRPTENRELFPGDCVAIGDTQLRLELESPLVTTIAPIHKRILRTLAGRGRAPRRDVDQTQSPERADGAPTISRPRRQPASKTVDVAAMVGKKFLRYRVESIIARPHSGIIFQASDPRYARPIALKIFRPDFFHDRQGAARFLRAMRTTIALEHENLVRVYGAGRTRGVCFIASEFVAGESVSEMIRRIGVAGMLDWRNAIHVAKGVAEALEFAHELNILHRNIGPSNILVRKTDRCVKLGDLMFAKAFDNSGNERITRPGEVIGDLRYLSPEQLSGEQPLDARADIYSLGAALYAILTGRPPFEGGTAAEIIRRIVTGSPQPPTKVHLAVPSQLEGLVLRMLAKRPEDRPDSARALRQELERVSRCCGA